MSTTENTRGTLYLCATPIGNLSDMTPRVIDTLRMVDIIAAEDTRNSIKLLNHFEISTPMTSYHEHNKYEKADQLVASMLLGKNIALITDAGTPAISDPGEVLVQRCYDEGIRVTSLPGACACITALTLSGLNTRRFVFEGFLPYEKKEKAQVLEGLKNEYRTIIMYEAPHHLRKTLSELRMVVGDDRRVTLCRELTKRFEEIMPMTFGDAVEYYQSNEPRGEYVLVIEGRNLGDIQREKSADWEEIAVADHVKLYEDQGFERKEAMKKAALDRGVSKREIYQELLNAER